MLLKSIARILVKHGLNAVGFGVAGDAVIELWDLWGRYQKDQQEKLAEIGKLAVQPAAEARRLAEEVVAEVAGDRPDTVRQALTAYLSQVPNAIRQSQRRPQDPSGRTVSSQLRLQRPEDLLVMLPTRAPRFKVGDRPAGVGDWELEELLGMGGFGEVWKAKNPHMPHAERVALKFCLDPAAAKVLRHEAAMLDQVMRQGKHPGIVQLRHTYFSADVPCLEYEFVSGGDLTSLVYRHLQGNQGKLPEKLVTNLMRSIIRAVRYAHRLAPPIVHRDLKPANILVQPRPDGKVELRVADFGIGGVTASCTNDQTPGQFLTTASGSCTPLYCSPQQARGEPPDPRDDVHALGVIWYQLLVGDLNVPPGTDWHYELSERQVPRPIIGLLGRCLSSIAERRPADAEALAQELDKLPGGDGKKPPPLPPPLDQDMKEALEEQRTRGDTRPYFERQGPTRIAAWRAAAEKGVAAAQWLLARCLQLGTGSEQDAEAALSWLRRAAEGKLPVAQTDLGDCYYTGEGVKADPGEAFRLYTVAAAQGFGEALTDLGDCYCEGKGVAKDLVRAAEFYRKAADAGWARGQTSLGDCYYLGEEVEEDSSEAFRLYTAAAAKGYVDAQVDLGDCYHEGKGAAKDLAEAARCYRKAAEAGSARGQDCLGDCYFAGDGVEQDYPEAISWYRKAAAQGLASASSTWAGATSPGRE